MIADLQAGKALSAAMKKHVHIFRPVTVSVIEAGEQGGILQEMLSELAVYFGQKEEINRFLKNICLYPCLVLSLAIVTGCLFVVKLLPLFADLYQSFDLVPTLPLQVMMFVREIAVKYWQAVSVFKFYLFYIIYW